MQSTVSGNGNLQPATQATSASRRAARSRTCTCPRASRSFPGQLLAELNPQSAEVDARSRPRRRSRRPRPPRQGGRNGRRRLLGQQRQRAGRKSRRQRARGDHPGAGAHARPPLPAPRLLRIGQEPLDGQHRATHHHDDHDDPSEHPVLHHQRLQRRRKRSRERGHARSQPRLRPGSGEQRKLSVQSAEQAVADTRLYAPQSGTIASLSGQVGETVSGRAQPRPPAAPPPARPPGRRARAHPAPAARAPRAPPRPRPRAAPAAPPPPRPSRC